MKTALTTILLIILCSASYAQNASNREGWTKGSITLTNGTTLQGYVTYNHREDFITYRDGDNNKVFTSRNVIQIRFYDATQGGDRIFVSLPYTADYTSQDQTPYIIFEVLKEFRDFAVLSRSAPAEAGFLASTKNVIMSTPITRSYLPETIQEETVYIVDDKGTIRPYFKEVYRENAHASERDEHSKAKILNERLLAEYIGFSKYQKLQEYASENHLNFHQRAGFMQVLSYYETLR
jgi:hypothetical protein